MSNATPRAPAAPYARPTPGMRLAAQLPAEPKDEDLEWVAQMGVGHAVLWSDETKSSAEYYRSRKERFARYGIDIYTAGVSPITWCRRRRRSSG